MGCDIHLHVEAKINGEWHHYNSPRIDRDYGLFAKMAGVRNYNNVEPIAEPRGLPEDMSFITRRDAAYCGADGHSHSYFSVAEVAELDEWAKERAKQGDYISLEYDYSIGYIDGNSWAGWLKYEDEREPDAEDFRIVFWFDN